MFYIGISAYYHESSVFLTDNKGTNCFLKEESFTRIKGDKNFPIKCLKFLIQKYDLKNENIKYICFYEKPFKTWWDIFYYSIKNPLKNKNFLINHLKNFNHGSIFFYTDINKIIKIPKNKILYSSHHLSHCLYGLTFVNNVSDYVYITCDGVGEGETMSIFTIDKNYKIKKHWTNLYPNSIGLFYSAITDFLGFEINEGEFKVMSLSSYGKPTFEKEFLKIFDIENFKIDMNYFDFDKILKKSFSDKLCNIIGEPYLNINEEINFNKYKDIACSAQLILEKTVKNLIIKAIKITGKKKIILTGGVALNCKMIHNLSEGDFFDELIIPPSPGDSGSAIGAANFAYLYDTKIKTLDLKTIFLGPSRNIITDTSTKFNFFNKLNVDNDFLDLAASKLKNGEIITTFLGNGETGPRSLGNTSILCNAMDITIVKNLNLNLKKRNHFQPLAPIVLEKNFDKYFFLSDKIKKNLKWMGTLCIAKENLKKEYKSIIHVDGTCRTQIINNDNFLINDLMKKMEMKGIDILVNTSFNISKDPVVFDLYDAFVNMKRMGISLILMNDGLYEVKNI